MFTVREVDGKLLGRGVIDDKGPAAILIHVLQYVKQMSNASTVQLALTTDEEVGSINGV